MRSRRRGRAGDYGQHVTAYQRSTTAARANAAAHVLTAWLDPRLRLDGSRA